MNPPAERLEMRVTAETKSLVAQAASLRGLTVSAYVLSVVSSAAQEEIERSTQTKLSNADRDIFLAILDNPRMPSDRLKKAAQLYREALAEN
jgi:uncharacterized protein (DUF1778 family)